MKNRDKRESLLEDVGLLLFLTLFSITAVLMTLTGHELVNVIYLFCTVGLLIVTYFYGLLPSILSNMLFMAIQAVFEIYQYLVKDADISWQLSFWILLPLMLSLSLYFMTRNQVKLQQSNSSLRTALIERGAFDQQTNLRTTVAYVEDVAVFIETNRRFNLPVTTAIIKIRYFDDLKRMMSENQLETLLKITSTTIKEKTRTNDITYLLNNDDPTWAILLYSDADGAQIAADRIKNGFNNALKENTNLVNLAISMVVGIASWDEKSMHNPYDLMNAGIHETQFDV
ncbi:diguanylate cyclase [Paucilactobacillus suebicus]|uniref:GGDEF domain-containing protein n=1 Tax=Paucilactobacillus suebicus DSM 5007 = KCTC 3549 TaxID=1423807 RepID=A0A0R1W260_9LACO|nr:diguanylate cyclase [Paucilactobacillus suebicus]KRM11693.1 GGDEF domain-containing protein [Paucilactobacillus suebicus DSM 5007 = KCTC 3549]